MTSRVAALILAAGQGSRFGAGEHASKVTAHFRGLPLVRTVAMTALASRAMSVTVVVGHAHAAIERALEGLEVCFVRNPAFATGIASSIKVGLATMDPGVDGVLVMLADMPSIRVDTLDRLIARFDDPSTGIDAAVPVHGGRRGNPVLIGRRLFPSIETLTGDEGARALLLEPHLTIDVCDVTDPGIVADIDTPIELEALDRRV